jgi:adenylate kinase family enzyme
VSDEVPVLLSAARFYDWNLHVIYIDVSDAWAHDRLVGRGRADDLDETERARRIAWFHDSVMPGITLLKQTPGIQFVTVNGERPIEDIQVDIATQLGL